jgi:DNA-binding LytR/AlgR family response regulator
MRCLIIDDESASRSRLKRLLATQTDVEVVGEAEDGMAGLEMIVSLVPDLIFLDIEMPIVNGIQMLKSIPTGTALPIVIFITGYDAHALAAFEADALAYLLKPVEEERLASTLERARRLTREPRKLLEEQRRFTEVVNQRRGRINQIVGKKRDRFFLLRPADVIYFSAEDGLVKAYTVKEQFAVDLTLNDLEESLSHLRFFRAHRSALVNLNQIVEIQPSFRSSYVLLLANFANTEVQVSERQAKRLRDRIPGL